MEKIQRKMKKAEKDTDQDEQRMEKIQSKMNKGRKRY